MKKYPKEIRHFLKILNKYEYCNELEKFDILHLYPKKLAYIGNKGYWDTKMFRAIGYNTKNMTKRKLGLHDSLMMENDIAEINIKIITIYLDGSTMIKFTSPVIIYGTAQSLYVKN